jgi:hypothetical protein
MRDLKQGTSSSYLIELRKLTTQKREDQGKHDRVGQSRWKAGLTGSEKSARTWWNGQEKTWAESQEESSGHDQVGLGQYETQRLRDETVDEEEHESVEEDSHLIGLSISDLEAAPVGGQKNAWAERQKKGGWNRNFLGGNIWEHG